MVTLLRLLNSRLSDTIDAWDIFQRKEIGYFLLDDTSPTTSLLLEHSVSAVEDVFLGLKTIFKKLQALESELCQDIPYGVGLLLPKYELIISFCLRDINTDQIS
jgi:hypothetical protein